MNKKNVLNIAAYSGLSLLFANQAVDVITDRNILSEIVRGDGRVYCDLNEALPENCHINQGVIEYHIPSMSSSAMRLANIGQGNRLDQLIYRGEIEYPASKVEMPEDAKPLTLD